MNTRHYIGSYSWAYFVQTVRPTGR